MTKQTSFLNLTIPSSLEEPYLDAMNMFFGMVDENLFSAVVDRNLVVIGGGEFNWDLAAEKLTWTKAIRLTNFVTGFFQEIPPNPIPGGVSLRDGEFLYTDQVRGLEDITGTVYLDTGVASKLLTTPRATFHTKTVICVRYGDSIIFGTGVILPPDKPLPILEEFVGSEGVAPYVYSIFLLTQFLNGSLYRRNNGVGPALGNGAETTYFFDRNPFSVLVAVYSDGLRMIPGVSCDIVNPRTVRFSVAPALNVNFVLDMYEPTVFNQGVFGEANIWAETPQGLVNGANDTFAFCLPHVLGTLRVYLDGLRLREGTDFTVLSTTSFQLSAIPAISSVLLVDYVHNRTGVADFLPHFIFSEVPAPLSPVLYQTLNSYVANTTQVYLDGERMKMGVDYTETSPTTITFAFPIAPLQVVLMDYQKV
jgi:hypothetical protein